MGTVSIFDLVLLIITGFFAIRGLVRGIAREVFSLMGLVLAIFAAIIYTPTVRNFLRTYISKTEWLYLAAFCIVFFGVIFIVTLVETIFIRIFAGQSGSTKEINGFIGFLIGALEGVLLCSILVWLLRIQLIFNVSSFMESSQLADIFIDLNPLLDSLDSQVR